MATINSIFVDAEPDAIASAIGTAIVAADKVIVTPVSNSKVIVTTIVV